MASPVDTSVKFFTDEMLGVPTLNGTTGALIGLLDACLVTGFGSRTAVSLTVSGGVATVTLSSDAKNPALLHSVILVAGVTGAMTDLNGEQRVTVANMTTLSFPTALADGTATGTITVKTAPLGWVKEFTGTNLAVYKPSDVMASSARLRVDDTGTTSARVRMFETMSDVSSGTNPSPTDAKLSGGLYWYKSDSTSSTFRKFTIFGDARNLYYGPAPYQTGTSNPIHIVYGFGDLDPYKSGDAYCGFITGDVSGVSTSSVGSVFMADSGNNESMQIMRSHTGLGVSLTSSRRAFSGANSTSGSGADNTLGTFPAPANNGLFLSRVFAYTKPLASNGPRGLLPGALYVPQTATNGSLFARGTVVEGSGEFSGRQIYAIPHAYTGLSTLTNDNAAFFDLTGPWRN